MYYTLIMTAIELDEICLALEPRPGNDSYEFDPELNGSFAVFKSPAGHRTAGSDNGTYDMADRRRFAVFPRGEPRAVRGDRLAQPGELPSLLRPQTELP